MSFQVNRPISHYFEYKWDCLTLRIIYSHNTCHSVLLYAVSGEIYSLASPFSGANESDLLSIVVCTRNCWGKTWIKTSTHFTHQLCVSFTLPVSSFSKRYSELHGRSLLRLSLRNQTFLAAVVFKLQLFLSMYKSALMMENYIFTKYTEIKACRKK